MSIRVNDKNWIKITADDPSYEPMKDLLTIVEKELVIKKKYDRELRRFKKVNEVKDTIKYLYSFENDDLLVPLGLLRYVKYLFKNSEVVNCNKKEHPLYNINNVSKVVDDINQYREILQGISLYDNQLECIKRIFEYKRGVIQAGTGFGKSEVMCATIQIMKLVNNNIYPTVLVLEPTIELLNGMKSRFKKYKIPINDYRESRVIMTNKVNLAHPNSLVNDLKSNKKILDKVEVQFMDECHHAGCKTWSYPSHHMENLLYSVGLSATFLSHYHANGTHIDDFSYDELLRIGTLGPLLIKVDGKELIKRKQLATPKLVILHNNADELIDETKIDYDWHNVRKIRLQSKKRTKLIAEAACMFAKHDRKVIILMNILDWGRDILREIHDLGYGSEARTCFGGQTYEKINKKGKIEKEYNSTLKLFNKNKIKIVIGSSCLTEGIDLDCVDVCILAQGGRSDRVTLQSVGRALRRSKNGKFAYIVDFDDCEDRILSSQFRERQVKYKKVLGINNENDILKDSDINTLENQFIEWEELNS